jgi:nucleoside-diphosphate-sugar epimerase
MSDTIPPKILVTGATGFVGRALCSHLRQQAFEVHAAVRSPKTGLHANRTVTIAALGPDTDWAPALQGINVVVHLAARVHVMRDTAVDPAMEFRTANVDATLHLARQAAAAGVRRLVFLSSVKANGESTLPGQPFRETDVLAPQDDYGRSKCEAEQGLRQIASATGLEVVIIRSPLVYGPGVKANFASLMRLVARGWPLPLGGIHNRRSLVGSGNLVDFIATCAIHPGAANQTFLVSDGHDLSTTELVRSLAQAADVPARLLPVPVGLLLLAGRCMGQGAAMQRLCDNLQVDISKARELLHWQPPIAVSTGLAQAYQGTRTP